MFRVESDVGQVFNKYLLKELMNESDMLNEEDTEIIETWSLSSQSSKSSGGSQT